MFTKLGLTCIAALCFTACTATGPSVADYGMGDESGAIKAARSKSTNTVTVAELEQSRRQRTNIKEELELEDVKRQRKMDNVNGSIRTVGNVLSIFK